MKPDMELALAARAENIAIVRHALGGLGEVYPISQEKLSDIRLAVTEACSNVVVHAYPEHAHVQGALRQADAQHGGLEPAGPESDVPSRRRNGWGMMEVSATMMGDELAVVVRDWGEGIRPRPDSPGLGLGLSLIAALAETVQLGHDTAEHTEVRMTFALAGEEDPQSTGGLDPAGARLDRLPAVGDGQASVA